LSHRGEHALERISGPQMDPMLGREVIKRQQIEGVERLVGPRTTPRLSSFRNFFPQGFPCCEVTTTSSRLPAFHGHTLIASVKYFAWPRIVVHRRTAP
jgi:hypothetical protein